jgi:hypothetical protein
MFQAEWVRSVFSLALASYQTLCKESGREICFLLFERYYLDEDPESGQRGYSQLALEFEIPVSQVTNYLAFGRREFRRLALEKLRELTGSDEEYRREAHVLFGVKRDEPVV